MARPMDPTLGLMIARSQAHWMDLATRLAAQSVGRRGFTALIMRMRARQALRFHGQLVASLNRIQLGL